ncbi:hypothetical protein AAG570_004912 [Ranatra chinensis]|uniref:Gamma-tubulin complex component 6 n=1 Tax=Ranatra chinensis TaxID=642074 RepID=A0ABD0XZ86_9HEMI
MIVPAQMSDGDLDVTMERNGSYDKDNVYGLVTRLCGWAVAKADCHDLSRHHPLTTIGDELDTNRRLVKKLRAISYEILLNKYRLPPPKSGDFWDLEELVGIVVWAAQRREVSAQRPWTRAKLDHLSQLVNRLEKSVDSGGFSRETVVAVLRLILTLHQLSPSKVVNNNYVWDEGDRFRLVKNGDVSTWRDDISRIHKTFTSESLELGWVGVAGDFGRGGLLRHWVQSQEAHLHNLSNTTFFPRMKRSVSWAGVPNSPFRRLRMPQPPSLHSLVDEGFVTPNEDHREVTPAVERKKFEDGINDSYWDISKLRGEDGTAVKRRPLTWETSGVGPRWGARAERCLVSEWEGGEAARQVYTVSRCEHILDRGSMRGDVAEAFAGQLPPLKRMVPTRQLVDDVKSVLLAIPSDTFKQLPDGGFEFAVGTYTEDLNPEVLQQVCLPFAGYGRIYDKLVQFCQQAKSDIVSQVALEKNLRYYTYQYERLILAIPQSATLLFVHNYIRPLTEQMCLVDSVVMQRRGDRGHRLVKDGADRSSRYPDVSILDSIHSALCLITAPHLQFLLASMFVDCCRVYYELLDRWVFGGWQTWNPDFLSSRGESLLDRSAWQDCGVSPHKLANLFPKFLHPLTTRVLQCAKTATLVRVCRPKGELLSMMSSGCGRPKIELRTSEAALKELEEKCSQFMSRCSPHISTVSIDRCFPYGPPRVPKEVMEEQRAMATQKFNRLREERQRALVQKKVADLDEQRRDIAQAVEWRRLAKEQEQQEDERTRRQAEQMEAERIAREEQAKIELVKKYRKLNARSDLAHKRAEWRLKRLQLSGERNEMLAVLESAETWGPEAEDRGEAWTPAAASHESGSLGDPGALETPMEQTPAADPKVGQPPAAGLGSDSSHSSGCQSTGAIEPGEGVPPEGGHATKPSEQLDEKRGKPKGASSLMGSEYRFQTSAEMPAAGLRSDEGRGHRPGIKLTAEAERIKRKVMDAEYGVLLPQPGVGSSSRPVELKETHDEAEAASGCDLGKITEVGECSSRGQLPIISEVVDETSAEEAEGELQTAIGDEPTPSDEEMQARTSKEVSVVVVASPTVDETPQVESTTEPEEGSPSEVNLFGEAAGQLLWRRLHGPRLRHRDDGLTNRQTPVGDSIDFVDWQHWAVRSVAVPLRMQSSLVETAAIAMLMGKYSLVRHLDNLRRYFFLLDPNYKRCLSHSLFSALESRRGTQLGAALLPPEAGPHPRELSAAITTTATGSTLASVHCLDGIGLSYRVGWPLNLVLTNSTLEKYHVVFQLMVAIQRANWYLEQVVYMMKIKAADIRGSQYRQLQLYRHVMSHYISAVQSYLINTVLDSCWTSFNKSLESVKEVDDLYHAHVTYIKDVLFKCLLNKRSSKLREQLMKLLEMVYTFYAVMRSGEWELKGGGSGGETPAAPSVYTHSRFSRLRHSFRMFLQLAHYITRYVERLVQLGYQAHDLDALHKSLTLNSFYLNVNIG